MGVTIEEFVSKIKWDTDNSGVQSFENAVTKVGKAVLAVSAAVVAGATALAIYATKTAQTVAVQTNLANAMDVSAETMETWGYLLGAIGGGIETAQKSFKVLNDRMGELAQGAKAPETLTRAVSNLNLKVAELRKLAPEEQFEAILQASQDAADGQLAMSSATELLGRDGVKLVGFVRTQTRSVRELLVEQAKMNLQTEEGRAGAVRLTAAMDNLGAIWESATGLGAGLFGKAVAPLVEKFNSWVAANHELVQSKIDDFVEGLTKAITALYRAFVFLAPKLSWFFGKISDGIKAVGGFEAIVRLAGFMLAQLVAVKVIAGLAKIIKLVKAGRTAAMLFSASWFLVPIVLALIAEDIYQFVKGNESLIGEMVDGFKVHYDRWVRNTEIVIGEIAKDLESLGNSISAFYDDWENKNTDTLGTWVAAVAEAFGTTEQNVQQFLLSFGENLKDSFSKLVTGIKALFDWLGNSLWDWNAMVIGIFVKLANKVKEPFFAAFDAIKKGFKQAISFIRTLPGFGSFGSTFGLANSTGSTTGPSTGAPNSSGSAASPSPSFPAPSLPRPSAAGATSNSSEQTISVTNHITQQPGESGEALADKVSDSLNKAAASIQRNLSTGLAY